MPLTRLSTNLLKNALARYIRLIEFNGLDLLSFYIVKTILETDLSLFCLFLFYIVIFIFEMT